MANLSSAKKSYETAKAEGSRLGEAQWANVIGNMLKKRGEYAEALKWLSIDYDLSVKYLPQKHCLPACQSLGELYLCLELFQHALLFQNKHLQLAEDANDLVEQQRANTQLGRTYYEMLLRSEDDHYSVQNAKKYFKDAMKLAHTIKENPPTNTCSFLKEYIDAHNNIGMLAFDLDNLEEARKMLTKGLEICDEEGVGEDDDGRSRLHHNLGNVYMKLRMWDRAREHIDKDIMICKRIGYRQGEAKGYINLGELHYRVQNYQEALRCYQKALDLAKLMEDEDALLRQIHQNIGTVNEAGKVMDELHKEEQNLKKLTRDIEDARGRPRERHCLLQKIASLDCLIEKSRTTLAWTKLSEFANMKKIIASELDDREKLSDSFLVIGEAYENLREFEKALEWYTRSWKEYQLIGDLEGQTLAEINVGNVLDSGDDWQGALAAFEESYRLAIKANLPSVQLTALENMHYSYMIRFDKVEEARRVKLLIDELKQPKNKELQTENVAEDRCLESDRGDNVSESSCSLEIRKSNSSRPQALANVEELKDDVPLIYFIRSIKASTKVRSAGKKNIFKSKTSPKDMSDLNTNERKSVGRKRARVFLPDHENEIQNEVNCSKSWTNELLVEDFAPTSEFKSRSNTANPIPASKFQDVSALKCTTRSCNHVNIEESSSSCKPKTLDVVTQEGKSFRASTSNEGRIAASGSKCDILVSENILHRKAASSPILLSSDDKHSKRGQGITFKIDKDLIDYPIKATDKLNIESIKVELACLYYLGLPVERRSDGLLPIIRNIKFGGQVIESLETFEATVAKHMGQVLFDACIGGWNQKRLIKLYTDCCNKLSETPNTKVLMKLYDREITDDDVPVSECGLQDLSITPLLNALDAHKKFAILDLSHNSLGNSTMEKLQKVLTSSGYTYSGLSLDVHCNLFGPTALLQICECPLLFARLEVLNISKNPLTDACASYLSTILENCKALYSLSMERCRITSRTIRKVADALNAGSPLEQLCIGYNEIDGNALTSLLVKLGSLKRFSSLNLNGLKLKKHAVDSLCNLASILPLFVLMLRETGIGTDGASLVTESLFIATKEIIKLDLSYCGVTSNYALKLSTNSCMICGILELNLSGNPIKEEGSNALSSMLLSSECCLEVLVLEKCELGVAGFLQIMRAVSGHSSVEELNLADNVKEMKLAFTRKVSTAVRRATNLRFLDLSKNGFSKQSAEVFYTAWSRSRSGYRSLYGSPRKHIEDQTVHLFLEGIKCCVKPCCRKNYFSYFPCAAYGHRGKIPSTFAKAGPLLFLGGEGGEAGEGIELGSSSNVMAGKYD